jgi:hypothetical protein
MARGQLFRVPTTNSTENETISDVAGSKADRRENGGDSLYALAYNLEEHFHSTQKVAPNLANAIAVSANAAAWTYGNLSNDIIAAAGVASPFDIHGVAIDNMNANDEYQLALVKTVAAVDTVISEVTFVRTSPQLTSLHIAIQTPLIEANAQIRAKLASKAGSSTCNVKVRYHTY